MSSELTVAWIGIGIAIIALLFSYMAADVNLKVDYVTRLKGLYLPVYENIERFSIEYRKMHSVNLEILFDLASRTKALGLVSFLRLVRELIDVCIKRQELINNNKSALNTNKIKELNDKILEIIYKLDRLVYKHKLSVTKS